MKLLSIVGVCFILSSCAALKDPEEDVYVIEKVIENSEDIYDDLEHHHKSRKDTVRVVL